MKDETKGRQLKHFYKLVLHSLFFKLPMIIAYPIARPSDANLLLISSMCYSFPHYILLFAMLNQHQ